MLRFRTFTALLAVAATVSCTDLPLDVNGGSGGDFDIGVGGGTAPNYSWSGGTADARWRTSISEMSAVA